MNKILAILVSVISLSSFATLDKIDADGVTEVGGSSKYARMLPRTKADGKLDTSLLPPVADWASLPIAGLYYVSAGAAVSGNGSPQYPFNNITEAFSTATSGSAVLIVPGSYTGTGMLSDTKSVTLCGFGHSTYINSLTVTVSGTADLRLCGVRVNKLIVNGGTLRIWMSSSSIDELAGSAVAIAVTRSDMSSYVSSATRAYADAYAGYDTINKSKSLIGANTSELLAFNAGKLKVGEDTVAYMSDVSNATNGILSSKIVELEVEDARLAGLIAAETAARTSNDTCISNLLVTYTANMSEQIRSVGTNWNSRLNTLSSNISTLGSMVSSLYTQETNDIAELSADVDSVREEFVAADTNLAFTLRGEVSTALTTLRSDIPGIASKIATNEIAKAKAGIIAEAKAAAYEDTTAITGPLINRVTTLESKTLALQNTSASNTASIASMKASLTTLTAQYKELSDRVEEYNDAITRDLEDISSSLVDLAKWRLNVNSKLNTIKSTVNNTLYALRRVKEGIAWKDVTIPANIEW